MKLPIYQVDAFTDKLFGGNPAAVIPLQEWISEDLMQRIAMENNQSETVFFVPVKDDFEIRWFTPETEIDLCGHATLASAFVLFEKLGYKKEAVKFHSKSGILTVIKEGDFFSMDFPSWEPKPISDYPEMLLDALGIDEVLGVYKYRDIMVELSDEAAVKNLKPDFAKIKQAGFKIIVTAKGDEVDFVSRFFASVVGIDEDPVTGSAHAQLIPFWNKKLGKEKMLAKQLSKRGGFLKVAQKNNRVTIAGQAVFYLQGEIEI